MVHIVLSPCRTAPWCWWPGVSPPPNLLYAVHMARQIWILIFPPLICLWSLSEIGKLITVLRKIRITNACLVKYSNYYNEPASVLSQGVLPSMVADSGLAGYKCGFPTALWDWEEHHLLWLRTSKCSYAGYWRDFWTTVCSLWTLFLARECSPKRSVRTTASFLSEDLHPLLSSPRSSSQVKLMQRRRGLFFLMVFLVLAKKYPVFWVYSEG